MRSDAVRIVWVGAEAIHKHGAQARDLFSIAKRPKHASKTSKHSASVDKSLCKSNDNKVCSSISHAGRNRDPKRLLTSAESQRGLSATRLLDHQVNCDPHWSVRVNEQFMCPVGFGDGRRDASSWLITHPTDSRQQGDSFSKSLYGREIIETASCFNET